MATQTTSTANGDATGRRGRPTGDHEAKRRELLKAATSVMAKLEPGDPFRSPVFQQLV